MVSSALDMTNEELLAALERLRSSCAAEPEYVQLRSALPADWPL